MEYIFSRLRREVLLIFIGLFLFHVIANAQHEVNYDLNLKKDGTILGTSLGLLGSSYLISKSRDPISKAQINALNPNDVLGFDRSATDNYSTSAGSSSDIFRDGAYLVPLILFLSKNARSEAKEILVMYSEVIALNSGLTTFTKESAGRLRPYAYNPNAPLELKLSKTTGRSFYSGHVSHVASLSFFTASVFSDLYPDSNFRYLVWTGAVTAPAITAYLRYKAGRHFPTDVMVGYGVGALVGYFIPKLHKTDSISNISIVSASNGLGLKYQF